MIAAPSDAPAERDSAESHGRNRHRRSRPAVPRRRRRTTVTLTGSVVVAVLAAGYLAVGRHGGSAVTAEDAKHVVRAPVTKAAAAGSGPESAHDTSPTAIPGLGARTRAAIPAASRQVLVASGRAKDSADTEVTLWSRTEDGRWHPGAAWPAHNALHGWTRAHHAGDLRTPIGVFALSDAGGFEPDPGAELPYHHSSRFRAGGVGFRGEPLDEAFDYVIAINYNRVPGTSPLDGTQPLGPGRGGGIWVHVDHGGPTHGCVSVSAAHMVALLHALRPWEHPVIVMGDRASLAT
jgi:L,D-peptidoglycan transpeptidase YkuD (ErfK/YbiS/YcfS/YnhG family)